MLCWQLSLPEIYCISSHCIQAMMNWFQTADKSWKEGKNEGKDNIFIRNEWLFHPKMFLWKERGFVSAYAAPSLTLTWLFSTPPCLDHFLCVPLLGLTYQTRHSHTHGDGWAWPGHPARLRGVPVRKSPAAVSQAAALCWVGGAVGEPGAKRGHGPRWQLGGGRAVWSIHVALSLRKTHWYTREAKSWHVLTDPCRTHCDNTQENSTSYSFIHH